MIPMALNNFLESLPDALGREIFNQIPLKMCRMDGHDLLPTIYFIPSKVGWEVSSLQKKLWLFLVCPYCGKHYSLLTLGLGRDETETELLQGRVSIFTLMAFKQRYFRGLMIDEKKKQILEYFSDKDIQLIIKQKKD